MPSRLPFHWFQSSNSRRWWHRSLKGLVNLGLVVLPVIVLCVQVGLGMAHALTPPPVVPSSSSQAPSVAAPPTGTVDPVPPRLQLGQRLYLQTCATCHVGLPPAVMPTQTWRRLIQDAQHYSVVISPLVDPDRLLVWTYLTTYSRPLPREEATPFRLANSRFMKALHPRVELPRPLTLNSCVSCHPAAAQFDYRRLSPEWENAP